MLSRCVILLLCWTIAYVHTECYAGDNDQRNALQIMELAMGRNTGKSSKVDLEMILIDQAGSERVRKLRILRKEFKGFQGQVVYFEEPADVRGTSFLSHDYLDSDRTTDQWIFLPAMHKVKHISSAEKRGSFMGSDLTYGDLSAVSLTDMDLVLLKEGQVGGKKVWIIQAMAKDLESAENIGFSRSLFLVRQDNYMVVRSVNWLNQTNRIRYMDVIKSVRIGDIWSPTEVHIWTTEHKKTIHKTILKTSKIEYNIPLDEGIFSVQQLEFGY